MIKLKFSASIITLILFAVIVILINACHSSTTHTTTDSTVVKTDSTVIQHIDTTMVVVDTSK